MRNIWINISFKWSFIPITENSYCNRSNLLVIGKKIQKYDMKFELFDISFHVFYEKQMQGVLYFRSKVGKSQISETVKKYKPHSYNMKKHVKFLPKVGNL